MIKIAIVFASVLALNLPAYGRTITLVQNSFDNENHGQLYLNYSHFSHLTVTNGTVDLIPSGDQGGNLNCVGNVGACVDLDGSTGMAGVLNTPMFKFYAGDVIDLTFDLEGNRRFAEPDELITGFHFDRVINITATSFGLIGGGTVYLNLQDNKIQYQQQINYLMDYTRYSVNFVAGDSGYVSAYVGAVSTDLAGPILDNLSLTRDTSVVPEAGIWAMLLVGFAAAGCRTRRNRISDSDYNFVGRRLISAQPEAH